jgi:hypothetical protein
MIHSLKLPSFWAHAVLGILFVAGSCRAGNVSVNLIAPLNNGTPTVSINYGDGSMPSFAYSYIGAISWTQNNPVNSVIGSPFYTFCIEINQDVYIGSSNNVYSLTNLAAAPIPGPVPNNSSGSSTGMGAGPADAITRLWHGFYGNSPTAMNGTSATDLVNAAAFQLALWRLEYDWNSYASGGYALTDFSHGNFRATNPSAVISLAQTLLSDVLSDTGNYGSSGGLQLVALTSPTLQDQVTIENSVGRVPPDAPEPSSLLLAFIGGATVLLCGYRRRKVFS